MSAIPYYRVEGNQVLKTIYLTSLVLMSFGNGKVANAAIPVHSPSTAVAVRVVAPEPSGTSLLAFDLVSAGVLAFAFRRRLRLAGRSDEKGQS